MTSIITTSRALHLSWLSLHIHEAARTTKVPNGFFDNYSKPELVSIVGIALESPLHLAVQYGRVAIAELLLEQGANVHARDVSGSDIIAVGMEHNKKSDAETPSGRVSLCVDLVIKAGGIAAPTF